MGITNRLKLGIDVRILTKPEIGISVYTIELVSRISRFQNFEIYLYSPSQVLSRYKEMLDKSVIFRESRITNVFLKQFWGAFKLAKLLKKDKIDVFWGPAHRLPFIKTKGVKYVLTVHDLVYKYAPKTMNKLAYPIERLMLPRAIAKADYIVVDSFATMSAIKINFSISDNIIDVLYLGSKYKNRIELEKIIDNPTKKYFLFVGTLEPRKNLSMLLKAYSMLSKAQKENFNLHLVGAKGWGDESLEEIIEQLNISEYVKIYGYIDDDKLAIIYANCYAVLMPSIYEGFGLPLLEGMTFGKPGLCGNNSSMPEIVGNAGVCVDSHNVNSIRQGLERISNKQIYEYLQKNIDTQIEKFDWDISAKKLERIFLELKG
ncbi:glycosyltransferase family 4 protein [Pseudofrancisella aestuarii]|uniref:Glycosyltransferase family 4 protein n=1 Tax=Pseudofrancisella aestuarii TaxID=2670347 RepID=A0ABV9TC46_9GAMM|nr:glycosyltransferase family 1 protein [Pseudofrancisella aestuarii]